MFGTFVLASTLGWVRVDRVFIILIGVIIAWVGLIVLAIIGALFLGMFLSHRILSVGGFTPFEAEMIRMQEDIKIIKKILENLQQTNNESLEPGQKK